MKYVKPVLLVVLAAVLLFAIGMATRMPAMRLGINFGLHAVLAAFFYGAVVSAFEAATRRAYPVVIGSLACGAVLGGMSPVMAVAEVLPAVACLAAHILCRRGEGVAANTVDGRAVIAGVAYAAFAYVGVIVGGALFSGRAPEPVDLAFLLLTVGLGLLGSIAGASLVGRLAKPAAASGA